MIQPVFNRIFVKIEGRFQDEIKTESGIVFYKDTTFNPEENSTVSGIVVATPLSVDKKTVKKDFKHNVQVGDKLYFHYGVTIDDDNFLEHEGEEYVMVDYYNAIAVVRGGQIIPVGSYILIEPLKDEIKSSALIIPNSIKYKEGNRGVVFASNDPDIPKGAEVEYEPIGKFWNIIEGVKVYCMKNSNILLKYEDGVKPLAK